MRFLEKVKSLNDFDPSGYHEFHVGGCHAGYIRKDKEDLALSCRGAFERKGGNHISLNENLTDFESRSKAVADILPELEEKGAFAFPLKEEMFPVVMQYDDVPLLQIPRNATIFFGVRVFGLHVNGYTWKNGKIHMWLGRRGPDLNAWQDRLDQMVAGGQPIGMSLEDNLLKEAWEEASLPREIAGKAIPAGHVSYQANMAEGVRRDTLFVYDLELPEDVKPQEDGIEVAGFECLPVEEVMEIVRDTDNFKPNCNLVAIDFFIRHGFMSAEEKKRLEPALRAI